MAEITFEEVDALAANCLTENGTRTPGDWRYVNLPALTDGIAVPQSIFDLVGGLS